MRSPRDRRKNPRGACTRAGIAELKGVMRCREQERAVGRSALSRDRGHSKLIEILHTLLVTEGSAKFAGRGRMELITSHRRARSSHSAESQSACVGRQCHSAEQWHFLLQVDSRSSVRVHIGDQAKPDSAEVMFHRSSFRR
ncbi:hypothetical protein AAFF_G00160430 [Aldrovandia affinis]|uniref:Uncharacterized protein n=1 Tax=Aldrovandia affinis TaxID=143900 RepID=A0AAD7W8A3_9TELE|nr:hypothetical protein AAFF_G00160430 [Aldrovandia affinis]